MFGNKINNMLVGVFSITEYEIAKQMCTLYMDLCRLHEMNSIPIMLVRNVLDSCGHYMFLDCLRTLKEHLKWNYSREVEKEFYRTFQPMLFEWHREITNTVQPTE